MLTAKGPNLVNAALCLCKIHSNLLLFVHLDHNNSSNINTTTTATTAGKLHLRFIKVIVYK
jgi:hypothetical protein